MDVKEYIKRVYTLEKQKYELNQLYGNLQSEFNRAKRPNLEKLYKETSSRTSDIIGGIFYFLKGIFYGACCGLGCLLFCTFLGLIPFLFNLSELENLLDSVAAWGFWGCTLLGALLGIISCIYIIKDGKKERQDITTHNTNARAKNEQLIVASKIRMDNIQLQASKVQQLLNQTTSTLDSYYSLNIVPSKYHGLVPISRFYDYFSTGICTQLEGHEGAYRNYEYEIRLDRILTKLDVIIDRLDDIRDTQYMLYSAIQESNKISRQICDSVTQANYQLQNINENTAASRYYDEITAINTTYMAYFKNYNKKK